MNRTITKLQQELEQWPTDEEVAEELGVEVEKVKKMRSVNIPTVRLDSPVGDESDGTLADFIPDNRATDPAENSSIHSDFERIQGFISKLPQRDREILSLRFGLNNGGDGLTLDQVGKVYGVTREGIRKIEFKAFHKLKALIKQSPFTSLKR